MPRLFHVVAASAPVDARPLSPQAGRGDGSLRRRLDLPGFPAEHRALAGDAPVIAGELAGFADRRGGTAPRTKPGSCRPRRRPRARPRACRPCRRSPNRSRRRPIGILQERLPDPHLPIGADQHHAQRLLRCHCDGSKMRRAIGAVRAASLDVGRLRPAALHVGKRGVVPRRDRRRRGRRARARSP